MLNSKRSITDLCKCLNRSVYESDEQPLFSIFYCKKHDAFEDGFGKALEPSSIIQAKVFLSRECGQWVGLILLETLQRNYVLTVVQIIYQSQE